MDFTEVKNLIGSAKNIAVIPSLKEPESIPNALALFYTLKELQKNVNVLIPEFPEKYQFLIPSLDFISSPKNLVISIPRSVADVSQIYYEKSEENLKIHLTLDKGNLKKEQVLFYYSGVKPDVVITLGVTDFQEELKSLDQFGFIMDAPIINIDKNHDNKRFGKVNIIADTSLSQVLLDFTKEFNESTINQGAATCLLTGLILHHDNFQDPITTPEAFEASAYLMKKGANRQEIIQKVYNQKGEQINFAGGRASNTINSI
jgi:hypothetical protein